MSLDISTVDVSRKPTYEATFKDANSILGYLGDSSSLLYSVAYDHGMLAVRFKNTKDVYTYLGVPASKVNDLFAVESSGSYFTKEIKDKYLFVKI